MNRRIVRGRGTAATVIGALVAAPLAFAPAAYAQAPGVNGKMAYVESGYLYVANSDGSSPLVVAHGVTGAPSWSANGARLYYGTGSAVWAVAPDGSDPQKLVADAGTGTGQPSADDGHNELYFAADGQIDGMALTSVGGYGPVTTDTSDVDGYPAASPTTHDFAFDHGTGIDIEHDGESTSGYHLAIAGASQPDYSPDGTQLAYIGSGGQVYVSTVAFPNDVLTVTGTRQVTTNGGDASPHWSPDGTGLTYSHGTVITTVNLSTDKATVFPHAGTDPVLQPVVPIAVQRVAGATAIGTAIAASQYDWANGSSPPGNTAQTARAVVLSRSDTYYDALSGSALAIHAQGPLLLTPPSQLDPAVETEIKRVLYPGQTVYLLGGTAALSPAVASALQADGYQVVRLAGADMYGTAIAVAKQIVALNQGYANGIFLATALQYYDALAAGDAAGQENGAFVLLTDGAEMPAETSSYIKQLDADAAKQRVAAPVQYGIGGPGDRALNSWDPSDNNDGPSYVGANAEDTALLLADSIFYFSPHHVAIATSWGWYDALSGGAMAGDADGTINFHGGPVLLTSPTSLYPGDAKYLADNRGGLAGAAVLGGPKALPQTILNQVAQALGPNAVTVPPLQSPTVLVP